MKKIRFGIIGAGNVANLFCETNKNVSDVIELAAVFSMDHEQSVRLAEKFGIPKVYDNEEEFLADEAIDAVYVGSTGHAHYANSKAALLAEKHVLCEKTLVMRGWEAEDLFKISKEKNLMLMEAMWNAFHPVTVKVREAINDGVIGDITTMIAPSGVRTKVTDQYGRVFNPKVGGGALIDFGCYALSAVFDVMGEDFESVYPAVQIGDTGVDVSDTLLIHYPDGRQAVALCSCITSLFGGQFIYGTKGYIKRNGWNGAQIVVYGEDTVDLSEPFPEGYTGYEYEQRHFVECINKGLYESPVMPHSRSRAIMKCIDAGFEKMRQCEGFIDVD